MADDRTPPTDVRPVRLFVALDVPDDVRELVDAGVQPIRERFPQARWVPFANQHVTMKFLGSTWPKLVAEVLQRVGEVAARHAPFVTRTSTLGAFPSARRARVLWVGLDDHLAAAAAIAASLDRALVPWFEPEKRAFTPHLTVARFEPPIRLEEDLHERAVASPAFEVAWLTLYRSHLQRPAPWYEPLATFPLGTA